MIYKLPNHNIHKHILQLRKGVCECMDDWEKFNETTIKEDFYSHLNMEDTTDADYTNTKRDCKEY